MKGIAYYTIFLFAKLVSLLPLCILYLLSDIIFALLYFIKPIRYRGKVVRKNLTNSFPEKSLKEIRRIERRFYLHFIDTAFETVKSLSMPDRLMKKRMDFTNLKLIDSYVESGRSVILFIGHLGNWEWVASLNRRVTQECAGSEVYHPLENSVIDRFMLKLRQRYGGDCIPMNNVMRQLFRYKSQGKEYVVGMIADQIPLYNNIHYWTRFLNQETPVLSGVERIARKMDSVVMYVEIDKLRRGRYSATFRVVTEHPGQMPDNAVTEQCFRLLEKNIKKNPSVWLWSHNRWKRTREGYDKWLAEHNKTAQD